MDNMPFKHNKCIIMEFVKYKETNYSVSRSGEIVNHITNKHLRHSVDKLKYHRVHPHINGKHTNLWVHRMVAECYIDNPENKPFVLHKDNDPENNNDWNLKWGTQSENVQQAYDENRISAKGEKNGRSKLTEIDVKIIREARKNGFKVGLIAKYYGMGAGWIGRICNGYHWTHQ